jgi:hypothetical protein
MDVTALDELQGWFPKHSTCHMPNGFRNIATAGDHSKKWMKRIQAGASFFHH